MNKEKIREIRLAQGLTQHEFAKALGLKASHVGHWEQGVVKPSITAVRLLTLVDLHGIDYVKVERIDMERKGILELMLRDKEGKKLKELEQVEKKGVEEEEEKKEKEERGGNEN